MSIHIDISDEAQHDLIKQKRINVVSAFISATLIIALVGVVFLLARIIIPKTPQDPITVYIPPMAEEPDPDIENVDPTSNPTNPQTPTDIIKNIDPNPDISLPIIPQIDHPTTPSQNINIDIPTNIPGSMESVPDVMRKRCSLEDRLQRIQQYGGSPQYEKAVVSGLHWIQKQQQPDGSWKGAGFPASMTGLALLSYLAHCETPASEELGESCYNAIAYLVDLSKKNNGYLTTLPLTDNRIAYDHAIATYALTEAYTLCKSLGIPIPELDTAVDKAAKIILNAQANDGGWMYAYRTQAVDGSHPDLSVTGWNIQALKALSYSPAKDTLPIARSLKKATSFVKKMSDNKTGEFYYSGPSTPRPTMTPVGVLSLQMLGQAQSREARDGLKSIEKSIQNVTTDNAYFYYYTTQALINRGGSSWEQYGKKLSDQLVSKQEKDGSWKDEPVTPLGPASGNADPFYKTALSILTLEVYYRFLPGTGEGTLNTTYSNE